MSLYDNPMIDAAKNAMTEEQKQEYAKIGEYMYTRQDYKIAEVGSKIKEASTEDLASYAIQGVKSGLDPNELTDKELAALIDIYGDKWYESYGYSEDEIRKPFVHVGAPDSSLSNNMPKITRQQRRALDRALEKAMQKERNRNLEVQRHKNAKKNRK